MKIQGRIAFACVCLVASSTFSTAVVNAADYEYPELMVVPRASERLAQEASHEASSRWSTHLPVQLSALTTLGAGLIQLGNKNISKDPDGKSGMAGVAVGGAWLAATLFMGATYTPYASGVEEIKGMASKSPREQLARERMAEERIHSAARMAKRIQWISAATNLAASAYMLGNAKDGSLSIAADVTAMAASLTPLIFQYRWTRVARSQNEYKKKIYGPVAQAALIPNSAKNAVVPGMLLSWDF